MASAEWNVEPAPIPPPAPGTVRFYASSSGGSSSRNLWVTGNSTNFRFDGSTWTPFHLPGRVQVGNRIAVVSDKSAWMVGNYGTVARFDGTSWTTQKLDRVDYDLKYVAAHGDKVWISGSRGTLLHFDGRGWSNIAIPGLADFHLGDVFAASPSNIHVVACRKYDEVPTMARFDGTTWTTLKAGKPGCFKRLHGTAPDDIWAVGFEKRRAGDAGQAMHFDGSRWTDMPLPSDALINDVSAVSRSLAWAVGGRGTILRWDGRAWTKSESGVTSELTAVFAPSDGPAVAAGMQILRHK